jgi:hypothetical protein
MKNMKLALAALILSLSAGVPAFARPIVEDGGQPDGPLSSIRQFPIPLRTLPCFSCKI